MSKRLRAYTDEELSTIRRMDAEGERPEAIWNVIKKTRRGTTLIAIRSQVAYQRRLEREGKAGELTPIKRGKPRRAGPAALKLQLEKAVKTNVLKAMIKDHGEITILEFAQACEGHALTKGVTLGDLAEAVCQ